MLEQPTQYQKEVINAMVEYAVVLPLPELSKALSELGSVGDLVSSQLVGELSDPDRTWKLEVSKGVEI